MKKPCSEQVVPNSVIDYVEDMWREIVLHSSGDIGSSLSITHRLKIAKQVVACLFYTLRIARNIIKSVPPLVI